MANDDDSKIRNRILDEQYALDYDLIDISNLDQSGQKMSLPKSTAFDPGEGKIEETSKKIMQVKTLQNSMIKLLMPIITDRSIITPQQFRMKIRQMADLFLTAKIWISIMS